jgi:hypothetical protein
MEVPQALLVVFLPEEGLPSAKAGFRAVLLAEAEALRQVLLITAVLAA